MDGASTAAGEARTEVAPSRFSVDTLSAEAQTLPDGAPVRVAGRVVGWRRFGGLTLGHIQDRAGRVQVSLQRSELPPEQYDRWSREISLGDFVGGQGVMWTTDKGERTVGLKELVLLTSAVRPMPDKWAGIANPEVRYRKRYLDLLTDETSRGRFVARSRAISTMRRFLDDRGFLEVETPILQDAASGAAARPFVTHHEALGRDYYLRISPETYLKRLVAGSLERVYEIGRNFRNEGVDPSHLQEFTMLEWYAAYWDYRDNMEVVRELMLRVLDEVVGSRQVTWQGVELDFDQAWPEVDFREAVERATGVDLRRIRDAAGLRAEIAARGLEVEADERASYGTLVDRLYKRFVRPTLVDPVFLVHHPVELVPLARRSDDDPTRLDMFQVVVNGWELVKAYSELVDPVEQRRRLEEQVALGLQGDEETMMLEEDFLEAMEHGMPPMSGLGLGVDRFVALITDAPSVRDVVLFPQLREA